jgi:hypothetical protein
MGDFNVPGGSVPSPLPAPMVEGLGLLLQRLARQVIDHHRWTESTEPDPARVVEQLLNAHRAVPGIEGRRAELERYVASYIRVTAD